MQNAKLRCLRRIIYSYLRSRYRNSAFSICILHLKGDYYARCINKSQIRLRHH